MKKQKKYYAVRNGRVPGIYTSWQKAKQQVNGYPDARFKSFSTRAEAEEFNGVTVSHVGESAPKPKRKKKQAEVTVYTDGGSRNTGNYKGGHVKPTNKAAWAYLIEWQVDDEVKQEARSGGEYGATNNKMELTGLIEALKKLIELGYQNKSILCVLDSQYVLNPITQGWLKSWKANGWHKSSSGAIANLELWQELDNLLPKFTNIKFKWTRGHANNRGNEFVDSALNDFMDSMYDLA